MFSTKSQHAGVAFSELEKKLIVEGIAEFLPILSLPGSHQSTYRRKTAKWDEIRDRCSKVYPFLTRPTKAIKKKWGQMHYKAKQKKVAGLTEMDRAVLALYEQISQPQSFGIDNNENAIESEFAYEAQVSSGLKEEKEGRLEALILRLHARANGET